MGVFTERSPKIGLLLAPLTAPVACAIYVLIIGEDPRNKDSQWDATAWIVVMGAVTVFYYLASIFLGVPLIRVLRRLDRLSFWPLVIGAAFLGAIVLIAVILGTGGYVTGPVWMPLAELGGAGAFLGAIIAMSYGWLAGVGGGNPDEPSTVDR